MPYRRRAKRTMRRKTNYMKNTKSAMSTALLALSVAKAAKALLNVEHKVNEVSFDFSDSSSPKEVSSAVSITEIPDNDTYTGRDGRKVRIKSIYLSSIVSHSATAPLQVSIYLIRSLNKTALTQLGVFKTTGINPLRALDSIKDFKILWSRHVLQSPNGNEITRVEKYFKVSLPVMFDKDDTAGTTYASGALHFLVISNNDVNGATSWKGNIRTRYLDN